MAEKLERTFRVFDLPQERFDRGRTFIREVVFPIACALLRIRITVHDMERYLPKSGPAIVIMNHSGGLDPLVVTGNLLSAQFTAVTTGYQVSALSATNPRRCLRDSSTG